MAHAGKLMTQSYSHDADPSGMTPNPDAPRVPKPKTTPKWLDAWSDPMAHVDATSELMDTADLAGDGEWRLVMCSRAERKIKVWANARLVSEQSLPDEPVAMRCFYALPTDGGARSSAGRSSAASTAARMARLIPGPTPCLSTTCRDCRCFPCIAVHRGVSGPVPVLTASGNQSCAAGALLWPKAS